MRGWVAIRQLLPRLVHVLSSVVSVLCALVLVVAAAFDAQAERFTSGRVPAQFAQRLDPDLLTDYDDVVGVAHNAGDDLRAATQAVAYGADAIEIDVRSAGDELFASHDAPVPLLEDIVFRGPPLDEAWRVARLRDSVLLHLKGRSTSYLERVRSFLLARPRLRTIIQTNDPPSLHYLRRTMPWAKRLLLVLDANDLQRLRTDPALAAAIDGVSIRDNLLSPPVMAWLDQQRLDTFVWTINDERRMNDLIARGVEGLITDRLDIMQLLGEGPEGGG